MFVSATARALLYVKCGLAHAIVPSSTGANCVCFHHELASFEDPIKLCKNLCVCKDDKVKCICLCEALNTFVLTIATFA